MENIENVYKYLILKNKYYKIKKLYQNLLLIVRERY